MAEAVLAFLAGLLIGSFLNVCIYRLPRDLSVVHPRSFCPACVRQIAWYDNVPLLSFVVLRGRCRHCKASIPLRYPLVELATGLVFAWAVMSLGLSLPALKLCVFGAILIALVATDFEERILPDEFTLGGTVVGFIFAWGIPLNVVLAHVFAPRSDNPQFLSLLESMLGAVITSGSILLVAKLYEWVRHREGMGLGDVKMVAMIGAFLGLQGGLLTLIIASMAGGIGGLLFILLTGRNASTYQLPFGAFLGIAAMVVGMFGESLMRWYLGVGA